MEKTDTWKSEGSVEDLEISSWMLKTWSTTVEEGRRRGAAGAWSTEGQKFKMSTVEGGRNGGAAACWSAVLTFKP